MIYTFEQLIAKLRLSVILWHELDVLHTMVERRYQFGLLSPLVFIELDKRMADFKRENYPKETWT